MKVSIFCPANMEKFSKIIGKSQTQIEQIAVGIGKILAENKCRLVVVFNYSGMLKLVGDSYKKKRELSSSY